MGTRRAFETLLPESFHRARIDAPAAVLDRPPRSFYRGICVTDPMGTVSWQVYDGWIAGCQTSPPAERARTCCWVE